MTNSINRYYPYQSFDYSIKIKPSFQCFSIFTLFTIFFFLAEVGCFFIAMAKKGKNSANIFLPLVLIDWLILSIQCVPMDRWPSVREVFYDRLSILSIKNKKIFNRCIDNIDENETKSIDRYRSIAFKVRTKTLKAELQYCADCAHLCIY
jgi:hypothetical protein